MGWNWMLLAVLLTLLEWVASSHTPSVQSNYPLTIPLGLSFRSKLDKTLEDGNLDQFLTQYEEMIKASKESFNNINTNDNRQRRIVAYDELDPLKEDALNRRWDSNHMKSHDKGGLGRRRARSQTLRRDKLNKQGLRSHIQHSKQNSPDFVD